ncbi:TRAP transporter substrate-binding protein [Alkalihalobacillus sp. BA299]|uniref:TRAP transporter substrate-binding protein n=1 Tax=Alkalihalobacillus sp. BA299 TaxID=2815938 RepID=UPI001AD9A546|nr:TRAP transporter substrate-binding protein DctP [Alkalihalobacillus sp. BA299]
MNKKCKLSSYSLTLFILSLFLFLSACSGNEETNISNESSNKGEVTQKPVDLKFGMAVPATHPINALAAEPWTKTVEEETDGLVKVDIHAGAVLGSSTSVLQDVSGGVYDIGFVVGQFFPETPLYKTSVLDLPFAFANTDDHLVKAKIAQKFVDKYVKADLENLGVKIMGVYLSDPAVLLSSEPIRTVDDLKGKLTFLQGPQWQPIINGWGARPVSLSIEDLYTSLERGTLDVGVYALGGMYSQKLYEPAPYITNLPTSTATQFVVMNANQWNSMSPELQEQFSESFNPNIEELINNAYVKGREESFEKIKEEIEGKGEIIEPSEEELARFLEPAKDVWDQWIEEANKKGYDGQEIMQGFLQIMEEEGVEPPFEF